MLGLLANLLAGTVKQWVTTKAETSRIKAKARAEAVSNGIPGFSDEWLVIVWSLPMILVFIPPLQPYITIGFEELAKLPTWYISGYLSIVGAVFGIDKLLKYKVK